MQFLQKNSFLYQKRESSKVSSALKNLKNAALSNNGNLLELSVEAIKVRATVGEISLALEEVFGRFEAKPKISKNIYSENFDDKTIINDLKFSIKDFKKIKGRAPKIFVCKLGQDGHDRGAKVVASSFADLGFEVELSKLFLTPEELFDQAKNSNADVVGISSHAAGHLTLVPKFMDLVNMNNEKLKEAEIKFGNPLYVYDLSVIEDQFKELNNGFRKISNFKINYAVKSLSNISILKFMKRLGTGLDTVSIEEVRIGLSCGFKEDDITFTNNFKRKINQNCIGYCRFRCPYQ